MKLTVGLLCFLAIVVAIVAPPVVKNAQKNKGKADPKDDENSDDVVTTNKSRSFTSTNLDSL